MSTFCETFILWKMSSQGGRWSKKAEILSTQFVNYTPKGLYPGLCCQSQTFDLALQIYGPRRLVGNNQKDRKDIKSLCLSTKKKVCTFEKQKK